MIFTKSGWKGDILTLDVFEWPTNWRRVFFFTLPISLPLWFLAVCGALIFCVVAIVCLWPLVTIERLWKDKKDY